MRDAMKAIGIGWRASSLFGWGIYALNLTRELLNDGRFRPCWLRDPHNLFVDPVLARRLAPVMEESRKYQGQVQFPFPVFHCMGNDFERLGSFSGSMNAGFFFIESTRFSEAGPARAREMDVLVAGSTWNRDLVSQLNVPRTVVGVQGVDPGVFCPAPVSRTFPDRFVIFSGGKLEYRKGQDLVIAAFRTFRQRHPDGLLVLAWHNYLPQFTREIGTAGHVAGLPAMDSGGRWQFGGWLQQNGVPAESFIDVVCMANYQMPFVMRQADVGLFPNRCEGGTNLVAMETMACGVPCILSRNTGHLDIIGEDCLALEQQGPCKATETFPGVEGWGESSVEEILAHLEWAYEHRKELAEKGARAAERMRGFWWEKQVRKLMEELGRG
jgi:glycosyltransferase involved in cell wall biosynthesis